MIPLYALNPANFTLRALARAAWKLFRGDKAPAPLQDIRTFAGTFWGTVVTPGEPYHPPDTFGVFPTFGDKGSFLSLGSHDIPPGKVRTIEITPERPFAPSRLWVPSTAVGLDILELSIAGETMLDHPCPIELFSEVATIPNFAWHTCPAGKSIVIKVAHTGVSEDESETRNNDDGENRSA